MARLFHDASKQDRAGAFSVPGWRAWFGSCLSEDSKTCYVATNDTGAVCGFITGFVGGLLWMPESRLAYEGNLWVDPTARGAGDAEALIAILLAWAKEHGCSHLTMGSNRYFGFKGPAALYRNLGFHKEEETHMRAV